MSETNTLAQVQETIGRIGGSLLRAYGRTCARLGAAVARDVVSVWISRSSIREKTLYPVQWAWRKVRRMPAVQKQTAPTNLPADIARLLTLLSVMANEALAKAIPDGDPGRGEKVHAFLANLDFGEIMEMVEASDPRVLKSIETFNEELWKYPAKVGTLVATLIPLINIITKSVREIMVPIEKAIGPDLLADIVLSLVKGINGADTARLINTSQEVFRRVHTGSLMLGRGGKPLMEIYLTDVLKDCLSQMDPELLRKARIILSEDRLSIARSVSDALMDNPELVKTHLSSLGSVKSSTARAKTHRLRVYEELDPDRFDAALSESASEFDTYEIAELINTACRLLNRVHGARPELILSLAGGIVDSIDRQEIRDTVQWFAGDLAQALKPLAPILMPAFINAMNELIRPEQGFGSTEQLEAIEGLRATFARAAGGEQ